MEYIKSLFKITVDVLWLDLMKKEDEEKRVGQLFAMKTGQSANQRIAHKIYI